MDTYTVEDGKELAKLPVARIQDVLLARLVVREEAARLGFGAQAVTQMATAVSEITRNVIQHAGGPGQLRVSAITRHSRRGLKITIEDEGVGIAEVERAMTGTTPGAGIPGSRRLMDEFAVES